MAGSEERVKMVNGIPLNRRFTGEIFDPPEPLNSKLSEAARSKPEPPTAGGYAIERFSLPADLEIPPECLIGEPDEDGVMKFKLDSVPLPYFDLELMKKLPKDLLKSEGEIPYVFTPLRKTEVVVEKPIEVGVNPEKIAKRLEELKLDPNQPTDVVDEVKELKELQKKIGHRNKETTKGEKESALDEAKTESASGSKVARSRSSSKSKGKKFSGIPTIPPSPNPKPKAKAKLVPSNDAK